MSHKSVSKSLKIRCRVKTCNEEVSMQSYERHLKRFHPAEDPKDLGTSGQTKLSFGVLGRAPEPQSESKAAKEDINENVFLTTSDNHKGEHDVCSPLLPSQGTSEEQNNSGLPPGWQSKLMSESPALNRSEKSESKRPRLEDEDIKVDSDDILAEIETKVDSILENLNLQGPFNYKMSQDRIKAKLELIKGSINISKTVIDLEKVVKEVKKLTITNEKEEGVSNCLDEVKRILVSCRSVSEIETKVPEFCYDKKLEKVVCQVCHQTFSYDISLEQGRKLSGSLIHLKDNLKTHLVESVKHQTALHKIEAKDKICRKEETRNDKCGMNLGRTAFYLLSNGRPSADFTELLSMQESNGCDIGDINHSINFLNGLAKHISTVITGRVKNHLCSRLPQTGCLPPCKVVEDGATYRHDTRHLIGLTTVFPGDKPLIQSVFCGAPKGIRSDGVSTSKSIAATVSPYIDPEQYLGTSVDGANYLGKVGELLDKELGKEGQGHHDWDGVHAAATVDTGLRNPKKPWAKEFRWLNDINDIISKANRFHNMGVEWDRYFRVRM